jgi:hypothetical protein
MEIPVLLGTERCFTRDMSSRGVYVLSQEPMEAGAAVEMDVTLTSVSAEGPVTLHVRGRVIRVDRLDRSTGVAAVIDAWDVTDPGLPGFTEA